MKNAKDKCEILKEIRKYVAEKYGLDYEPTECNHKGDCKGTCPKCEAELADLQVQLQAKGITDITSDENLCALIKQYAEESQEEISESSTSDIEPMHTIGMPEIEGMEYFIPMIMMLEMHLGEKCYWNVGLQEQHTIMSMTSLTTSVKETKFS